MIVAFMDARSKASGNELVLDGYRIDIYGRKE